MERLPTLRAANVLFLITMGLILSVGTVIQLWSMWIGLIGTELFLILLPSLIYLRLAKLPVRETLRLRLPGAPHAAAVVVMGVGLFGMAIGLDALATSLFGYTTPTIPDMFPTTPASIVLCFVALAVFPPLCEEVLFRGLIQRGYERRGPIAGIVIGGTLFAFWHMRFQGLLPIVPVSLALGYVVLRSNSLITGILLHFTVNSLAATLLITVTNRPDLIPAEVPFSVPAIGTILAAAGLWWFHRVPDATRLVAKPPDTPEVSPSSRLRRAWRFAVVAWPLFIAAGIYTIAAGGEMVMGRYPEVFAFGQRLQLESESLEAPSQWRYEVRNVLDEPVGEAQVRLTADEEAFVLEREITVSAWKGNHDGSLYDFDETRQHQITRWDLDDVELLGAESSGQSGEHARTLSLTSRGGNLKLSVSLDDATSEEFSLPDSVLLLGEWPWRMSALPLFIAYAREVSFVSAIPIEMPDVAEQNAPLHSDGTSFTPVVEETHLIVRGAEPVWTPAGNFIAWVVTVGEDQAAWYDVDPPHTLLRYDDGILSYLLTHAK